MKISKNSINFTKAKLSSLPIPKKGVVTFCDTNEKGLSVYVTYRGQKTFFIQKRIRSVPKRVILGHFPVMSIDQARKAAQRVKGEIASGKNPCEEKQKLSGEKTFNEAYHMYMERYAKIENKPRSVEDVKLRLNKILNHLGPRKLSTINKYELQALHSKIGQEHGKYEANRVLSYISAVYNKMISWGWEGTNPTIGISKFREQKRDRFVLKDELPKLMEALNGEPNQDMKAFFLLCLYTGARKSNVLAMRWEDIDFGIKEWRIPDTKNGDPVRVPLIRQALEILAYRSFLKETSPWVFPSPGSKTGHLMEPQSAWTRILKRAGLSNLRIHDLRRTNGSYQAIAGVSLIVIGKSLGHKSPQSTAIYARLSNDPVRAGLEAAFNETES